MGSLFRATRKKLPALLILFAVAAGILWWQRTPILSWYYIRELAQAGESDRASWVDCVVALDADALPGLISLLQQNDAKACANSEMALATLARQWGGFDTRTSALAEQLSVQFEKFSAPGREAALEWYLVVLQGLDAKKDQAQPMFSAAVKLLPEAARLSHKGTRVRALALAEMLLASGAPVPVDLCRDMATQGMACTDAAIRSRAIRLVMHQPLHAEQALLDQIVPYLQDAVAEVRRSAVLAVGLAEETIAIQDLLTLLHDPDAEVRRLCEGALRGRGLQDDHVKLAIQISDPLPRERVKVVNLLPEIEDLDPEQWLLHLSQDSSPAVRAAAIRFAAEFPGAANFRAQMLQMSQNDPSPTVRQLAAHYLKTYKR